MIETKLVQKFGNGGHVILPREYVGKRVRFLAEPKTPADIKSEVLDILKPCLERILGIYLYGSYARNEQDASSDVDILVITDSKLKIASHAGDYTIISVAAKEIESILKNNAVLLLPIVMEAKTILNPSLLEKYMGFKFTRRNTQEFISSSTRVLQLNKKGIGLNFEIGSLVYSLMLRIRGLLIIKLGLADELYTKSALFDYLEENGIPRDKTGELYRIYSHERNNIKIKKSSIITSDTAAKLLGIAEILLPEVKRMLK